MGCSQSIEEIRTITTPGYKPKPTPPPTQRSGVAGYSTSDFLRTVRDPAHRPQDTTASGRSGGQIVAINARFCHATPVTLHLREKFWSLSGDDFAVKDVSTGAPRFRVSGSALSIREKKTLLDASGAPVATMKEVLLSLTPSYHVYSGSATSGSPLFEIHCKFTVFRTDLRVAFTNKATGQRCSLGLDGDWVHRRATIWLETSGKRRETVGKVFRPLSAASNVLLGTQSYYLEVAPHVDAALLTLVCIVLDEKASD